MVDDNINAMRQLDKMHDYQDRQIAAEEQYCKEFLQLAARGDAGAIAKFAPLRRAFASDLFKQQTLADVMEYTLDYGDSPSHKELMQLILNVANGQAQQDTANAILSRMAKKAAEHTVEVE